MTSQSKLVKVKRSYFWTTNLPYRTFLRDREGVQHNALWHCAAFHFISSAILFFVPLRPAPMVSSFQRASPVAISDTTKLAFSVI